MSGRLSVNRYRKGTKAFGARGTIFNRMTIKPHPKIISGGKNGDSVTKEQADPSKIEAYRLQKAYELSQKFIRKS